MVSIFAKGVIAGIIVAAIIGVLAFTTVILTSQAIDLTTIIVTVISVSGTLLGVIIGFKLTQEWDIKQASRRKQEECEKIRRNLIKELTINQAKLEQLDIFKGLLGHEAAQKALQLNYIGLRDSAWIMLCSSLILRDISVGFFFQLGGVYDDIEKFHELLLRSNDFDAWTENANSLANKIGGVLTDLQFMCNVYE